MLKVKYKLIFYANLCVFLDGWIHDRDHTRKNKLINWDKKQFVKFDENMNWGNAVFGNVNYYFDNYLIYKL